MNYYEHHLGDYLRDTAHLSMLEDGAYRRLLDTYYIKEAPLPSELPDVYRLVRAVTKQDKEAVQTVLKEFFESTADGWVHRRCDKEIARYLDKQAKAKKSAEARWSAKRAHSEGNADGMRTHSEGNAPIHHTPDTRHQTPTESYSDSSGVLLGSDEPSRPPSHRPDPCPHQEIIQIYHETLPELPAVKVWNEQRQALLRQRWRDDPDLDSWRKFFAFVKQSAFLTGKAPPTNGGGPFVADLEWLVRPQNFAKVIEGRYHRA